jgi:hypothetical protein
MFTFMIKIKYDILSTKFEMTCMCILQTNVVSIRRLFKWISYCIISAARTYMSISTFLCDEYVQSVVLHSWY